MATNTSSTKPGLVHRALGGIEVVGNKLPDPAMLFLVSLILVWILSALLAPVAFSDLDPRTGEPIQVRNLLTGAALTSFLTRMVSVFTGFAPLGVVLVAMLGVGVADQAGFFNTGIKVMLGWTAKWLLTPMVVLVGLLSHSAIDAGYVLVIPLGGIIFYAAGRHPVAGIAAAFVWQWPDAEQLGWLVLIAILGTLGQVSLAQSFRLAEVSAVLPLDFLRLIWASAIGYLLFAETPTLASWGGGLLIFASASYIAFREARLARQK